MPDTASVKAYYDEFSTRLLHDYVLGNRRVNLIRIFEKRAIHPATRRILEIGCGVGTNADFIRRKVAKNAEIVALDLSSSNIEIARALFPHPRITFLQADVLTFDPSGKPFDLIVLPDVYEHIPRDKRAELNAKLGVLLAEEGKVLITCPAPGYFTWMVENKCELQVIDEPVTVHDLIAIAEAVAGTISYLCMVSVGLANEYMHVLIERGADRSRRVTDADIFPLKMVRPNTLATRIISRLFAGRRMLETYWKLRKLVKAGTLPRVPWHHPFFDKRKTDHGSS